nr:MAG TPA: hypothetical protein [Caudoviricetes sp.]DAG86402.1 MAG TPA: hypothetical protein [Caudoviricetes sp.]
MQHRQGQYQEDRNVTQLTVAITKLICGWAL